MIFSEVGNCAQNNSILSCRLFFFLFLCFFLFFFLSYVSRNFMTWRQNYHLLLYLPVSVRGVIGQFCGPYFWQSSRHFLIQWKPNQNQWCFQVLSAVYMNLIQILIGSLCCLRLFWFVRVITLVLVLRHSIHSTFP